MADIAEESAPELIAETTKEVCGDVASDAVKHTETEETAQIHAKDACPTKTDDTTDEPESTGVKRKSEDDEDEDVKKVKTGESHGHAEPCLEGHGHAEPCPDKEDKEKVANGEEKGSGDSEKHGKGGDENGQAAAGDVPQEVVAKSVDEAVNLTEDVAASS